jgi:N-acetylglucosaminyldiphosphoundecaprenol N-acetyl-beta-D-mannosaminyltransferase
MEMALNSIFDWISKREPHYVCVSNVHGVMESQQDQELKRIHNAAGLVTPDGMPLVWLSRLMGFRHVERVYGPDLMLAVCERSTKQGYRHFFYGGAPGVAEKLAVELQSRFPGLQVAGTYSPPFRPLTPEEDQRVVGHINSAQSDIIWVGIGAPKQEHWMGEHVGRLCAPVLIGVGAAFDFHAGLKKQAPKWMQKSGLEWSFRLMTEPRRLWHRYLVNNPFFLWLIFLQALGRKAAESDGDIRPTNGLADRMSIRKLLIMRRSMMTADGVDKRVHGVWRKRDAHVKRGKFEDS